jgi:hypothetical protein
MSKKNKEFCGYQQIQHSHNFGDRELLERRQLSLHVFWPLTFKLLLNVLLPLCLNQSPFGGKISLLLSLRTAAIN